MTPGEAALMNTSLTSTDRSAAFRLSTSTSAAARSRRLIGPVQAGVFRRDRPDH
jgi:hypothetical protein